MFKFGFSRDEADEENEKKDGDQNVAPCIWFAASEVSISLEQLNKKYSPDDFNEHDFPHGVQLKLVCSDKVAIDLQNDNCENIVEAESQHSDLIPAKYEGGLKIWECSYDLGKYLLDQNFPLRNKVVLDLGCGAGVVGLIALLKGSNVHFQDYNIEVINSVTIPNVLLNFKEQNIVKEKCAFYSGDWESFVALLSKKYRGEDQKYDFILTSETIYNSENHVKLYEVFKQRLKKDGIGYVAGKTYYFGVGGGMRQFEDLIKKDGVFDAEIVWKSEEGLQREILKITRKS